MRVVALGDLHANFPLLWRILRREGLADEGFRLRQEGESKRASGASLDERAMRLARKLGAVLGE